MKSFLFVALWLPAANANAAMMTWTLIGEGTTQMAGDDFDYFLKIGGEMAVFPDLDVDDAGTVFTIDDITSPGLSFDWASFKATFDAGSKLGARGGPNVTSANSYDPLHFFSHGFTVEYMEWEFSARISPNSYRVEEVLRIYTEGAPEPASWLLMLFGLCFYGLHRHQTAKRAVKCCQS